MNKNSITADIAILIDSISAAAVAHANAGNHEAARHITRYAVVVLPVSARVARAWSEQDWDYAAALTSSDAVHAVRAMAA